MVETAHFTSGFTLSLEHRAEVAEAPGASSFISVGRAYRLHHGVDYEFISVVRVADRQEFTVLSVIGCGNYAVGNAFGRCDIDAAFGKADIAHLAEPVQEYVFPYGGARAEAQTCFDKYGINSAVCLAFARPYE